MKKKGFTLVEMLAVIVIMGIIIAVAGTSIFKQVGKSKDKVFKAHADAMKLSATNMSSNALVDNDFNCKEGGTVCPLPKAGESNLVSLEDLQRGGFIDKLPNPYKAGDYCSPSESKVLISNKSKNPGEYDLDYKVCLTCGNKTIKECQAKTKPSGCTKGVTCPPISCNVLKDNKVWTNKDVVITVRCNEKDPGKKCLEGTTTVKFSNKGNVNIVNSAVTVNDTENGKAICPVNVYLDTIKPSVNIEKKTNVYNWHNNKKVESVVVIKDKSLKDNNGGSGIATFGMGTSKIPTYNNLTEYKGRDGIGPVFAYARDNAGNETIVGTELMVDNEAPVLRRVLYGYEVYPHENLSTRSGDTIRLNVNEGRPNFKVKDYVGIEMIRLLLDYNSEGGAYNFNVNGKNFRRTVGERAGEVILRLGSPTNLRSLTISGKGIRNVEVYTMSNERQDLYTKKNVKLYAEGSDNLSGIKTYYFNDRRSSSPFSGSFSSNTNVKVSLEDKAGNISSPNNIGINNIDKERPHCSAVKSNLNTTSGVNISLSISDYKSKLEYSINWSRGSVSGGFSYRGAKAGTYSISGEDRAGNSASCSTTVYAVNQYYREDVPTTSYQVPYTDTYTCRKCDYSNSTGPTIPRAGVGGNSTKPKKGKIPKIPRAGVGR